MLTSCIVTQTPLPGAVLCLAVKAVTHFTRTIRILRSRGEVIWQAITCAVIIAAVLMTSAHLENGALLYLLSGVALVRSEVGRAAGRKPGWKIAVYAVTTLLAGCGAWFLLPRRWAWVLIGGTLIDHVLDFFAKDEPTERTAETSNAVQTLKKTFAGRTFFRLLIGAACAGEMTQIMLFRAFMLPTWVQTCSIVLVLLAAMFFAVQAAQVVEEWRGHPSDPTAAMILGLLIWFIGTLTLRGEGVWPLLWGMTISGVGCGLCALAMGRLMDGLANVARFMLGDELPGWQGAASAAKHFALLSAAAIGAGMLTAILVLDISQLAAIAGLIAVIAAFLLVCDFPLSRRYLDKLNRYFALKAQGVENKELEKQLEDRIVNRHHQALIIGFVVSVLKLVYRQKVANPEKVRVDEDNPTVFLCNHGDLHGPLASYITIPCYKRAWTISYICTDHQTTFDYLYKYDWSNKTFLPKWLRQTCAHVLAFIANWGTERIECIPVYRDQPVMLRHTFREATDAMAAGDATLIFPENPNAAGVDHGYETSGVGTLFSGFAMVAQTYYARTGKRCCFQPMFAHQPSQTIMYGDVIEYDPENSGNERQRISDETARQMNEMAAKMEADYHARRKK